MSSPIAPFASATELAAAIRRREVTPVEVADCYLDRMDQLDPQLNAFCYRADDDARAAAAAAADAVVRATSAEELPPFHGVPLPIKDLDNVAGWPPPPRGAPPRPGGPGHLGGGTAAVPRRPAADQGSGQCGRLAHGLRVGRRQPGAGQDLGPGRAAGP